MMQIAQWSNPRRIWRHTIMRIDLRPCMKGSDPFENQISALTTQHGDCYAKQSNIQIVAGNLVDCGPKTCPRIELRKLPPHVPGMMSMRSPERGPEQQSPALMDQVTAPMVVWKDCASAKPQGPSSFHSFFEVLQRLRLFVLIVATPDQCWESMHAKINNKENSCQSKVQTSLFFLCDLFMLSSLSIFLLYLLIFLENPSHNFCNSSPVGVAAVFRNIRDYIPS